MISINARRVLYSLIGIAIASLIVFFLELFLAFSGVFNITSNGSALWFQLVYLIVVYGIGILIGLLWEKSSRARYMAYAAKVAGDPVLQERAKKIYTIALIIAIIIEAFYLLSSAVVLFSTFTSGVVIMLSSAQLASLWIGTIRYIVFGLIFLWLYSEPAQTDVPFTLNLKKGILSFVIFFFAMAGFNIFGLSMFRFSSTAGMMSVQTSQTGAIASTTPSALFIDSLSPSSTPAYSQGGNGSAATILAQPLEVTIHGSGFTPTGNTVNFIYGPVGNLTSTDGKTIVFSFSKPQSQLAQCTGGVMATIFCEDIPVGTYPVSVTNANGTSNQILFSVTSTPVDNQSNNTPISAKPSIAILSPSGGETWQVGQEQTVRWTSVDVKNVAIFIHFSNGGMCREGIVPASPGEYSFVLSPACPGIPATLTTGQYTINITDTDPGSNNPEAWSSPFTIVAAQ